MEATMRRHWSFIVTDTKYLYPLAGIVLALGLFLSFRWHDALQFARAGNFIVSIGVWMTMRSTLRDGINKTKDLLPTYGPTVPGTNQLNVAFFNSITFSIGDAWLQVYGFALVVIGSAVWAYGDAILKWIAPGAFN
jgi:hypothetical protein